MTAALECRSLVAGYEPVVVVRGLDLSVEPGSVLAVLGPNGAGKTTLMMTLAGMLRRLGGDVFVDGQLLPVGKAAAAARAGLVLVPDDRALFTTLSVKENLEVAGSRKRLRIDDALDMFPALQRRLHLAAGALSGGEQQMLAMARALVQQPRVLLIDELSMGLAPVVVESLLPLVRHVAESADTAVVIVEQHVKLALEVADHALVLVHGDVSLRGPAATLAADRAKLEVAYLGAAGGAK